MWCLLLWINPQLSPCPSTTHGLSQYKSLEAQLPDIKQTPARYPADPFDSAPFPTFLCGADPSHLSCYPTFTYPSELHGRQIRLLYLEVGNDFEAIRVRLLTMTLDDALTYATLSCTWGRLDDTCNVICEGQSLAITRNLHSALWQIRQSDR
jgi:hypothetical protein